MAGRDMIDPDYDEAEAEARRNVAGVTFGLLPLFGKLSSVLGDLRNSFSNNAGSGQGESVSNDPSDPNPH